MTDMNYEVETILKQIEDATIAYQYPRSFNDLPIISFYTLSETPGFKADNLEWAEVVLMQVDVWSDKATQPASIGNVAERLMIENGWERDFKADIPKGSETELYHRTMRFRKQVFY